MKKALKVLGWIVLGITGAALAVIAYVKLALPRVAAPEQITVELTPQRIQRGSYITNTVASCMSCHSKRQADQFAAPVDSTTAGVGGEKFGREIDFPGNVYAPNITPYALKEWSDGEIYRALTTGVHKNGEALFPIMPYQRYAKMSREDLFSVIAYLRTLPAKPGNYPRHELDFPLNILVNTFPAEAAPVPAPDTTNAVAYGSYLVNAASCIQCHTPEEKGELTKGMEFGGGHVFKMENGAKVLSANITPDPQTGIGQWSKSAFIRRFKDYADSSYHPVALKPESPNTPMPWTSLAGMSERDLGAIYDYLRTVKPVRHATPKLQVLALEKN